MKTTLNKIRAHSPCENRWKKLLSYLSKSKADDEPLSITTVLDSNGLVNALWCLRAVEGYDRELRLYAVWCVRQVQHLMTDKRSLDALDAAARYANGQATEQELGAASAASAAARDAASAAAWAAAWDAARAAAWSAAWADASADASADARADAWADAWDAARDAARAAQEKQLRLVCASAIYEAKSKELNT